MDNLNIHFRCSVETVLGELEGRRLWRRFVLHYTPKHASWLNAAELEASLVSRECLGQRRVPSLVDLISLVAAWRRRAEEEHRIIECAFAWMTRGVSFGTKDSPRAGQGSRPASNSSGTGVLCSRRASLAGESEETCRATWSSVRSLMV